jgi:molybdopterin-guanine dinucleotide biosynthesis protein A
MVATPRSWGKRYNRRHARRQPDTHVTAATDNASAQRPLPPITAVILAGGSASRMGGIDKAQLPWQGRRFIDHIIERIAPQSTEILINSNRPDSYAGLSHRIITDPWPESRGPLAGLLAGMEAATTDWVLFVPCDCPQPATDLAQRLWSAIDTASMIAHACVGEDSHYLFCLMHRSLHPALRDYLQQGGRAAHRWMRMQQSRRVAFDDKPEAFLNINSPEAFEALRPRA